MAQSLPLLPLAVGIDIALKAQQHVCNLMVKLCIKELPGWYLLRKTSAEAQDRPFLGFFAGTHGPDGCFSDLPPSVNPTSRPRGDFPVGSVSSLCVSWALCEAQYSWFLLSRVVPTPCLSMRQGQGNGTFYLEFSFSNHHQPSPT